MSIFYLIREFESKLLLNKIILKPVCIDVIELCETVKSINIIILQQNKKTKKLSFNNNLVSAHCLLQKLSTRMFKNVRKNLKKYRATKIKCEDLAASINRDYQNKQIIYL